MKIRQGCNPFLIAGDRYADAAALLTYRGNRYAACTDGKAMVLVPVESAPDDAFPEGAVIPASKALVGRYAQPFLVEDGRIRHASGATFPLPEIRYPSVLDILRDAENQTPEEGSDAFGIDAARLAALQKAMGADALDVRVYGKRSPIVVYPIYGEHTATDGPIGAIMPVAADAPARKGRKAVRS